MGGARPKVVVEADGRPQTTPYRPVVHRINPTLLNDPDWQTLRLRQTRLRHLLDLHNAGRILESVQMCRT